MNKIKDLLERYWRCETSIEEEKELCRLFSEGELPEDLSFCRNLFDWKEKTSAGTMSKKFQVPKRKIALYPLLKIAALVLVLLTCAIGLFTRYEQEKKIDRIFSEINTETQHTPKETEEIVADVFPLNVSKEEQEENKIDSLRQKDLE